MEIELKLLIDPADVPAFRRHALLKQYATGKPLAQQLASIYFDTADLHFLHSDASLRVRKVNGGWVQTLKCGHQVSAGLHQRGEWEAPVDGPCPDLPALQALLGQTSAFSEALSDQTLAQRLAPIFTTRVRRTVWQLVLPAGDHVEVALDQGVLQHETAVVPINEVELELKSGQPDRLFDFAMTLQRTVSLRAGNSSKSARGYALFAPQAPPVCKATRVTLAPTWTIEQGFETIVNNCLTQIQGNEAGVMQGSAPEHIHQMRVGLRRLHSAIRLFENVIICPVAIQADLKWLASQLGTARDWEVLASSTLAAILAARPDMPELASLQQAAMDIAQKNRKKAVTALRSKRYAQWQLALGAWVQGRQWRTTLDADGMNALALPLAKFGNQALQRGQRKLIKKGKALEGADPKARHEVRIAAKKIRYATEFFQSLYPAKKVATYLNGLTALQDVLGWLNDASIADGLLKQLADADVQVEVAHSAGYARGYLSVCIEQDLRKLDKAWRKFTSVKLPALK